MEPVSRFPFPVSRESVERRIARFRRSWHASDLWPGVTEADFLAATRELAWVTAAVMGNGNGETGNDVGATRASPVPVPRFPCPVSPALVAAAHVSGMGPLMGFWIERGLLNAPPDAAALFAQHLEHGRHRAARLGRELERTLAAFDAAGVPATVLKGMHTGWVYFPEPGTRPMADLDLLVDQAAFPAARRALAGLGLALAGTTHGRETWRPPGPQIPHSLEMSHADDPWEVDLHVSLDRWFGDVVPARLGSVAPNDLVPLQVGDRPAHGLGQPLLTVLLAVHVSDHFEMTGLARLVELALVVRRDRERGLLGWGALLERLRDSGASRFVYPAFELTEKLVPGTLDPAFRAAIREDAPLAVRRLVDRTEPGEAMRLYDRSLDTRFMWLDGWGSRARWVAWRVWPHIGSRAASLPEAVRITADRLRRVFTRRMRWTRAR